MLQTDKTHKSSVNSRYNTGVKEQRNDKTTSPAMSDNNKTQPSTALSRTQRTFVTLQQYLNVKTNGSYLLKICSVAVKSTYISWKTCDVCTDATKFGCHGNVPQTPAMRTFQDQTHFTGPSRARKFQEKSRTFQDAWEPCSMTTHKVTENSAVS